ncbi:MAG: hypothetical protein DMG96_12490 [Acidobacteria bacterium]|nr:MAG: hypothetical protein DMG96_12490 [Acidobacteriota bacterium]
MEIAKAGSAGELSARFSLANHGCFAHWFRQLEVGWSRADDVQLSVGMLALLLWWIASFVVCFGTRASRSFLFPLLFLFWMVPIPSLPLNRTVEFLQAQSTTASRLMFSLIGVSVSQQGFVLSIPGVNIEVARECSSIRSSVMLLIASMVLAQVSLRSPWSKAAVIAATVPLSIAKNALRIVTLQCSELLWIRAS